MKLSTDENPAAGALGISITETSSVTSPDAEPDSAVTATIKKKPTA